MTDTPNTQPAQETTPAPQPPANPAPTPANPAPAPANPAPVPANPSQNPGNSPAAMLQQLNNTLAAMPELVANAVREAIPKANKPAPATTTKSEPAKNEPAKTEGQQQPSSSGGKSWWDGGRGWFR